MVRVRALIIIHLSNLPLRTGVPLRLVAPPPPPPMSLAPLLEFSLARAEGKAIRHDRQEAAAVGNFQNTTKPNQANESERNAAKEAQFN